MKITTQDAIKEVQREIKMRERVYPRWIVQGKLNRQVAERQLARMKYVLELLQEKQVQRVGKQRDLFG